MIIYVFIALLLIVYFINRKNYVVYNDYYDDYIGRFINDLSNYKTLDEYSYNKVLFHINKFFYYMYNKKFKKMEKHYQMTMEYINRIPQRIENNIGRERYLRLIIFEIEKTLIQYLYKVAHEQNLYYNNIRTNDIYLINPI